MKHTDLLKPFKKGLFLSAAALLIGAPVFAQPAVFTNVIYGPNPGFVSPFTTGQSFNVGITVSGISRGPGINGAPGDEIYNASDFTTSFTPDLSDYFEFTLTPNPGNFLNFQQFFFTLQRDVLGPTGFALRTSLDGFTTTIAGTGTANGIFATTGGFANTIPLTGSQFQNLTTPITFRLYGYASNGLGAQLAVNDFAFYGTVSSTPLSNNLLAFDARNGSAGAQLTWKTTCGSDARSFTVEKSVGGKDFSPIGTVNATTDACGEAGRSYGFTTPAEASRAVYRLAMRDASGYLEYSRSVTLAGSNVAPVGSITLAPSVVSNSLSVRGAEEGTACRIIDLSGRMLHSWKSAGSTEAVPVGNLPAGAYILVAESTNGPVAQRFWKQ